MLIDSDLDSEMGWVEPWGILWASLSVMEDLSLMATAWSLPSNNDITKGQHGLTTHPGLAHWVISTALWDMCSCYFLVTEEQANRCFPR